MKEKWKLFMAKTLNVYKTILDDEDTIPFYRYVTFNQKKQNITVIIARNPNKVLSLGVKLYGKII